MSQVSISFHSCTPDCYTAVSSTSPLGWLISPTFTNWTLNSSPQKQTIPLSSPHLGKWQPFLPFGKLLWREVARSVLALLVPCPQQARTSRGDKEGQRASLWWVSCLWKLAPLNGSACCWISLSGGVFGVFHSLTPAAVSGRRLFLLQISHLLRGDPTATFYRVLSSPKDSLLPNPAGSHYGPFSLLCGQWHLQSVSPLRSQEPVSPQTQWACHLSMQSSWIPLQSLEAGGKEGEHKSLWPLSLNKSSCTIPFLITLFFLIHSLR